MDVEAALENKEIDTKTDFITLGELPDAKP